MFTSEYKGTPQIREPYVKLRIDRFEVDATLGRFNNMSTVPVEFFYHTSFSEWPPNGTQAELSGSWDAMGRFSRQWTSSAMAAEKGVDGCLSFHGTVQLDPIDAQRSFEWGVALKSDSKGVWGIPTEVKEIGSTRQTRAFIFSGTAQREEYYLSHCRRLGANLRHWPNSSEKPGIQFSVWAPNARSVELVVGRLFDLSDPSRTAPKNHIESKHLGGGFISDRGDGVASDLGPFSLKRRTTDGVWETDLSDAAFADFTKWDHQPYMFRIVRDDGSTVYRTDLYSRCQVGYGAKDPPMDRQYAGQLSELEGRVSCSAVVNPDTVVKRFSETPEVWPEVTFIPDAEFWKDEWTSRSIPSRVEDLIIYELHMGALGFNNPGAGTIADAIQMLDYLVDLGVNAVELLPLSEFGGGAQNWGYNTSHYFAIEYAGGGRDKFKHFVKECHRRGLAVIFDVVYNHYDQDADRAERAYDSPAPERDIFYWYEGIPADYSFPRGGYLDNQSTGDAPAYYEEMVRKMFISSAVTLVQEFHVDGFRVDQTTSIHAYNRRRSGNVEVPAANIFGAKLLREFGRTLRLIKPGILLFAEDHSTWDQVTLSVDAGGMGFDARWFAEFYHHLIGDTNRGFDTAKLIWVAAAFAFTRPQLRMDYFANQLSQTGQAKLVYNESHDEAGNSSGPFLDPDWDRKEEGKQFTSDRTIVVASDAFPLIGATRSFAEGRCRFAYGMTVFSAGTPMFLFGEEVGAQRRFKYNKVLENKEDYLGLRRGSGKDLFSFYAAANRLRSRWPGLRSRNIEVIYVHNDNRVIAFRRWDGTEHYLVIGTLSDLPFSQGYSFQSSSLWDGAWREIFNSDSDQFGGTNVGNFGAAIRIVGGWLNCNLPANGFIVLQRISD
jgi:1,4-alpha-glucan branching enzyme